MARDVKKNQKSIVIDMRRWGHSYSEIHRELAIPKSTIASWLKHVTMDADHRQRVLKKRLVIARANALRRRDRTRDSIRSLITASASDIQAISKRELWLMGIVLAWAKHISSQRVQYMSSDPFLIKLFLRWLQEVGRIKKRELIIDLFVRKGTGVAVKFWTKTTGLAVVHTYQLSTAPPQYGILRIRVRASSLLARQILGWIEGIKGVLWGSRQN